MKKLVICRGLPGSGKSTLAKQIHDRAIEKNYTSIICSSDDLFMVDGVYRFEATKLAYNHKQNFLKAQQAIIDEVNFVIIDNTNVCTKEVKPYIEIALEGDYEVYFYEPETPWAKDIDECMRRGTHNVPRLSYERMLERWEETDDIGEKLAEELNCYYDITYEVLSNNEVK